MSIKISTGAANKLLDTGSLKATFAAGFIKIYSGAAPADADAAVTGTLLCTISISSGGTGINFDTAAAAGVLAKATGETWSGVNAATGTAGYFRHVAVGDTGVSSTTQARIQGSVGVSGADLNLTNISLVSAATQAIDFYTIALPLA
jgi:hypothetical protein